MINLTKCKECGRISDEWFNIKCDGEKIVNGCPYPYNYFLCWICYAKKKNVELELISGIIRDGS